MRDHLIGAYGPRASQLPVATVLLFNTLWIALTLLASGWLAANFLLGPGEAGNDVSIIARVNLTYALISMLVFGSQFACAAVIDGRPWKTYMVLAILTPLYPVYFWCVLFTSFVAGFPAGLMRRDSGTWQRTLRTREAIRLGAGP